MAPPNDKGGLGSLLNIGNILQSIVQGVTNAVTELAQLMPAFTSGQMSANTLVFTGFVRVTGISISTVGSTQGALYDAPNIAAAAAGNAIFPITAALGYMSVQMVFQNGLVYKPGTGEKITVFYVRS